jgi:hypothetical protein
MGKRKSMMPKTEYDSNEALRTVTWDACGETMTCLNTVRQEHRTPELRFYCAADECTIDTDDIPAIITELAVYYANSRQGRPFTETERLRLMRLGIRSEDVTGTRINVDGLTLDLAFTRDTGGAPYRWHGGTVYGHTTVDDATLDDLERHIKGRVIQAIDGANAYLDDGTTITFKGRNFDAVEPMDDNGTIDGITLEQNADQTTIDLHADGQDDDECAYVIYLNGMTDDERLGIGMEISTPQGKGTE